MRHLLVLLATTVCTAAWAAPRTHDGFFLQMNLGYAQQDWSIQNPNALFSELAVDGSGAQFDLCLGGAVAPNIIIFGQLGANVTIEPTYSARAGSVSAQGSPDPGEVTAAISTVGAGVAYYLMPAGVYFSGAALSTQLSLETDGPNGERQRAESDTGLGFQARIGKEWWVSDEWGIGLAAHYFMAKVPAAGDAKDKDWDVSAFGFTFSATYN